MARSLLTALIIAFLPAAAAHAQLMPDSDEPIDISGDAAEFQDNVTIWTGNVRLVQAEAILTAQRLEATLNDDGDFETMTATGTVRFSNGNEAITGERAFYEEKTRTITISENVIVKQGKQVMSAGAVVYWVDSGRVKFIPAPGKRIRGIFYTEESGQT